MQFTHLHVHTVYSFLDGYNRPEKLMERLKEIGQTSVAITDHNSLAGIYTCCEEGKKQGIKIIPGLEGYFTPNILEMSKSIEERKDDALKRALLSKAFTEEQFKKMKATEKTKALSPFMYNMKDYHILFLAKNQKGWFNLVKLQSEMARLCTFNGRFHCDMNLVRKYHEGLICTCACVASYPSSMIVEHKEDLARAYLDGMREIFGGDFYLEIQPLNIAKQRDTNLFYMQYARETGTKCIATNDAHWTYKDDWDDHDTLLCIGIGKKKYDMERMHYSNDFWIKSYDEMVTSFRNQENDIQKDATKAKCPYTDELLQEYREFWLEALEETNTVAAKCDDNIKLGSDTPLFPKIKVPYGLTAEDYLRMECCKGLYKYYSEHPEIDIEEYLKRLHDELNVIIPKGFAPYFLVVREYVKWSNDNGIASGPGRGSAAGSLALFSLGITKNIDPIKYGLWFSRFLTKDRTAMPDVDVDIDYEHRDNVIRHLENYYGADNVAHIGTYSTLGVKSSLKDICRVMDISFTESNNISKAIDNISDAPSLTFKILDELQNGTEEDQKNWRTFHELEEKYSDIFSLARKFEGIPRGFGVHASGILVTPMPVTDVAPVRYEKGIAITLYTGPQLEESQFVKLDILGLKTLTVIEKAISNIKEIKDINDLYSKVDLNDSNLYEYLANGHTDAVFQLSSNMMKGLLKQMEASSFNDIIATNSLGRPGPLQAKFDVLYSNAKLGKSPITYPIRGCEDILGETYGVVAYQEQLNETLAA